MHFRERKEPKKEGGELSETRFREVEKVGLKPSKLLLEMSIA